MGVVGYSSLELEMDFAGVEIRRGVRSIVGLYTCSKYPDAFPAMVANSLDLEPNETPLFRWGPNVMDITKSG